MAEELICDICGEPGDEDAVECAVCRREGLICCIPEGSGGMCCDCQEDADNVDRNRGLEEEDRECGNCGAIIPGEFDDELCEACAEEEDGENS